MHRFIIILLTILSVRFLVAQENTLTAVVLELFTSQGCSSCPPADQLLEEIKEEFKEKNVYVMSYHVDYWNRLGWKDPFGSKSFSDYQRDYAIQFNSASIYTPQLVVNGNEHFIGSDRKKAKCAIYKYGKIQNKNNINLEDTKEENKNIVMRYTVEGDGFSTITFALLVSERTTEVGKGENRNKSLKNLNIVANRIVLYQKSGSVKIGIPDWVKSTDSLNLIAYSQNEKLNVLGVTDCKIN